MATKNQIAITADLLARTLHHLEELGRPFVVLFPDVPASFGNVPTEHRNAIIRYHFQLAEKVDELRIEKQAEKALSREDYL